MMPGEQPGGYQNVHRFVHDAPNLRPKTVLRNEVDFGLGAWVMLEGKRRRPHLFRAVLAHSRKGYSEVVWRQTSESFLRCLENAFRFFGGVTATVVLDYVARHIIDVLFPPEICALACADL
jgi:transposase